MSDKGFVSIIHTEPLQINNKKKPNKNWKKDLKGHFTK